MKLSEMRQLLSAEGIQLTKSLGQNFLHDANQLQRIVGLAELDANDRVLEIGPGLGPLTALLVKKSREVLAIEKDQRLVRFLERRFGGVANLKLVTADALEYLRDHQSWSDWKVISNLPYSVGSPLLVELAQMDDRPALMVVTLQLEVVRRLLAKAGHADYGLLTVLIGVHYETGDWFKIPASCFFPEPDVASGCIRLNRRAAPFLDPAQSKNFETLVKLGFSQRRKMMFKLLKERWPEERLKRAFQEVGLSLNIRAEAVGIEQFVRLSKFLDGAADLAR